MANLPPYLFAEIDRKRAAKEAQGINVISLGIGDPDTPTPEHIVDAMATAIRNPANHRYPAYAGAVRYRSACAQWMRGRFGVELDPATEVLALIGGDSHSTPGGHPASVPGQGAGTDPAAPPGRHELLL